MYSPIFPPGTKPAHPGLYLTSAYEDWLFICLHRWDGSGWYDTSGYGGPHHAVGGAIAGQNRYWRGLSTQSKEGV